jgi:hypothetical protein
MESVDYKLQVLLFSENDQFIGEFSLNELLENLRILVENPYHEKIYDSRIDIFGDIYLTPKKQDVKKLYKKGFLLSEKPLPYNKKCINFLICYNQHSGLFYLLTFLGFSSINSPEFLVSDFLK